MPVAMTGVKLKDVARAAGVSQGTASNVFNKPETVSPKLRDAVLEAARALDYRGPAPAGRALRSGRAHLLAVVVEQTLGYAFDDPFTHRLLAGIGEACDEAGSGLAVISAESGRRDGWSIETAIADGFILHCVEQESRLVELARRRGVPFVAVDSGPIPDVPTVNIDDRGGAAAAAAHLVALGHRRVGVMSLELAADGRTGPVDDARRAAAVYAVSNDRLDGYRATLHAGGIPLEPALIHETLNDRPTAEAAIDAMFRLAVPPTALLAMSDQMALTALDVLSSRGLRIPDDVSVVGFDDVPEAARGRPPLTTVRQPVHTKGRHAARMLLGLEPATSLVLPADLAVRSSTAPPPRPERS